MGFHHCYMVDRFGRKLPRLPDLNWTDRQRLEHEWREMRGGVHADWAERARVLTDIEREARDRGLTLAQAHDILGLDRGRLTQGTLATPLLHAALQHMKRQPR